MPKKVRTRFAPSPTGFLHLGGLRTALYNYLFAKHHGGDFLLRIEDTDQARTVPGAMSDIIETLGWAGLQYDEGPMLSGDVVSDRGPNGPYLQSRRLDIYKKHAAQLVAAGNAYPCFCTPERLEKMRAEQQLRKEAPRYDGTCRNLTTTEIADRRAQKLPEVIRMKMPHEGTTAFTDEVHGQVEFRNDTIDDQVLVKSDGFPTYHLAVVIDDHLMAITHVIRGEEWLPSTPKHLQLYRFFGWDTPAFAHIPLFLNKGGGKLSKRDAAASVKDYVAQGYLKEALLNFVALLGWHPKGDIEVLSIDDMIRDFDLHDVHRAGAVLSFEKLDYLNGLYIRKLPTKDFARLSRPYLEQTGLITTTFPSEKLEKMIVLEQERVKKLSELPDVLGFLFKAPQPVKGSLTWKDQGPTAAQAALESMVPVLQKTTDWSKETIERAVKAHLGASGLGTGEALWPLRVALSGREASPGPFEIAAALGKEETVSRIKHAISILST